MILFLTTHGFRPQNTRSAQDMQPEKERPMLQQVFTGSPQYRRSWTRSPCWICGVVVVVCVDAVVVGDYRSDLGIQKYLDMSVRPIPVVTGFNLGGMLELYFCRVGLRAIRFIGPRQLTSLFVSGVSSVSVGIFQSVYRLVGPGVFPRRMESLCCFLWCLDYGLSFFSRPSKGCSTAISTFPPKVKMYLFPFSRQYLPLALITSTRLEEYYSVLAQGRVWKNHHRHDRPVMTGHGHDLGS